jgi:hypothetical protein
MKRKKKKEKKIECWSTWMEAAHHVHSLHPEFFLKKKKKKELYQRDSIKENKKTSISSLSLISKTKPLFPTQISRHGEQARRPDQAEPRDG